MSLLPRPLVLLLLAASVCACDQFLSISAVNGIVGNSGADRAAAAATRVLQTNNGGEDVACPVALRRTGSVFSVPGANTIDTDKQLSAIFAQPGYVKVVQKINRCGKTTNPGIIGCAAGKSMIVEDLRGDPLEGPLWAHEFGHTQGLQHRITSCVSCEGGVCIDFCAGLPGAFTAVMAASIGAGNNTVVQTECDAFAKPLNAAVQCNVCEQGFCYNQCSFGIGGASDPLAINSRKVDIQEFVRRIYPDSMPFEEAMRYGPENVPTLTRMLSDPRERASWPMIASVLGIIGDEASAHALIDFVVRERGGSLRGDEYRSVGSAIVALGYLVERTGSPTALEFLGQASEPSFWQRQRRMRWTSTASATIAARNQRLADFAVMGLGLSGHREARSALQRRWDTLNQRRGEGSAQEQQGMQDVVEQAMDDHARVTDIGLAKYYHRSHR
jgi:hypothetical protein